LIFVLIYKLVKIFLWNMPVHEIRTLVTLLTIYRLITESKASCRTTNAPCVRRCIQKFPYWPPGARTANGTALYHRVQFYRYFVSQLSEFCRYNPLCYFSTSVYCCLYRYDSVRKLLDTPSYVSRNSSVGIATRLRARRSGF
jgi:hypothetical protein